MKRLPEPTPEQITALDTYAKRKGRNWRRLLMHAWVDGLDEYEPEAPYLRQIRNTLGPRWLIRYRWYEGD